MDDKEVEAIKIVLDLGYIIQNNFGDSIPSFLSDSLSIVILCFFIILSIKALVLSD
jgi:hypothetical protein